MNNKKIFAVYPQRWNDLGSLHGIFDSLEKAEKFIERFKTRQEELVIFELKLNPSYRSDKNQDPYWIELPGTSRTPCEVSICTRHDDVEEAAAGKFDLDISVFEDIEDAVFSVKILAPTKYEALNRAVKIRDERIERGDWQRAHDEILKELAKF